MIQTLKLWMSQQHLGVFLACITGFSAFGLQAQTAWPQKTVRIMVGFPGGSTPDTAARILADGLSKLWGQPVVVEAKVGAAGNLAADGVAKANDDHTLGVVINGNLTSAKLLNPKLPYDPTKDLWPVSLLATAPLLLVSPADLPTGAAWVSAVRQANDKYSYGSVGIGSVGHLGMEVIKSAIGNFGAVHVPYSANPAIITAMLGGQVQMALMPPALALAHVQAGKLRVVGVSADRRLPGVFANVPTWKEQGVNLIYGGWRSIVGPKGLTAAQVAFWEGALRRASQSAEWKAELERNYWTDDFVTSAQFRKDLDKDYADMKAVLVELGLAR